MTTFFFFQSLCKMTFFKKKKIKFINFILKHKFIILYAKFIGYQLLCWVYLIKYTLKLISHVLELINLGYFTKVFKNRTFRIKRSPKISDFAKKHTRHIWFEYDWAYISHSSPIEVRNQKQMLLEGHILAWGRFRLFPFPKEISCLVPWNLLCPN